jgi:PhzF family phenazine biosynthesis protein
MTTHQFRQVDVFTTTRYAGNPVAVVHDAEGLDAQAMQQFAAWTNLSETTFLLPAHDAQADYRLRIFTPWDELPFAGHPTLGSAHAWLEAGGTPQHAAGLTQECAAGLIKLRRTDVGLAFAAPPLRRSGPVADNLLAHIADLLRIDRAAIIDAHWVDNGPGWVGVLLDDAETVLALRPGPVDLPIGAVGPYPAGSPEQWEVRAFFPSGSGTVEDPVTGSLNAALAGWLVRTGRATTPYIASQGTMLGRSGRVHITSDETATMWIGGGTITCVHGRVQFSPPC